MPEDKIIENIRKGRNITAITNILASILFFAAYYFSKTTWYIIPAIATFFMGIIAFFYFKKLETKFVKPKE